MSKIQIIPMGVKEHEMKGLPVEVKQCLSYWFGFPQTNVDCQVATAEDNIPHVRTMLLYKITEAGHLIFLSRTDTQKWRDLQKSPNVSICLLHIGYGQILTEGGVTLKTKQNDADEIEQYWDNMPYNFQKIYLSSEENAKEEIPSKFGIIDVVPSFWEILETDKNDYVKSKRQEFRLSNNTWQAKKLTPV